MYLVAHSWDSLLGAQLAARYPELFYAYVGIGQAADFGQTSQVLYQFALDFARADGKTKRSTSSKRSAARLTALPTTAI